MKIIISTLSILLAFSLHAQKSEADRNLNPDTDPVFIEWNNEINKGYPEKLYVKALGKKGLRRFFNQNLKADEILEEGGYFVSKGGFTADHLGEHYLVFSVDKGSLIYQKKVLIHIGPRQKLISSKN
ncbi:MAG: hypothetical protein AB8B73_10640 [Ekhidna sp.]